MGNLLDNGGGVISAGPSTGGYSGDIIAAGGLVKLAGFPPGTRRVSLNNRATDGYSPAGAPVPAPPAASAPAKSSGIVHATTINPAVPLGQNSLLASSLRVPVSLQQLVDGDPLYDSGDVDTKFVDSGWQNYSAMKSYLFQVSFVEMMPGTRTLVLFGQGAYSHSVYEYSQVEVGPGDLVAAVGKVTHVETLGSSSPYGYCTTYLESDGSVRLEVPTGPIPNAYFYWLHPFDFYYDLPSIYQNDDPYYPPSMQNKTFFHQPFFGNIYGVSIVDIYANFIGTTVSFRITTTTGWQAEFTLTFT